MLGEVKIFDSNGKIKNILSGEELAKMYWRKINNTQTSCTPMKIGKGKRFNKKKALEEFNFNFHESCENYEFEG